MRVVVAGELRKEPHNASMHLFSAKPDLLDFGKRGYKKRTKTASGVLAQLFKGFEEEGFGMPFTMEDFRRQMVKDIRPDEKIEVLQSLPPEERVAGLTLEQRLTGLTEEQRLAGLTEEQRLAGLTEEQRLAGLTEEQIRGYLDRLTAESPSPTRKSRKKKPPEGER